MIFIAAIWFIASILVGIAAMSRGRSGAGWFFLSMVVSPVICLVLLLISSPAGQISIGDAELQKNIKRGQDWLDT